MLEEARFAVLIARAGRDSSDAQELMSADAVLSILTRGGAHALGLTAQISALINS